MIEIKDEGNDVITVSYMMNGEKWFSIIVDLKDRNFYTYFIRNQSTTPEMAEGLREYLIRYYRKKKLEKLLK